MTILVLLASVWLSQACALKNRTTVPANFRALTVEALLEASETAYPVGAAGRLRGYVCSRRKQADGDWHLEIGSTRAAPRSKSVVCEITPRRPLPLPPVGSRVVVSGWLFWDAHHKHAPGRGTSWEIHPITGIVVVDAVTQSN